MAVKSRGGIAIVQNPEEAMFSGMPKSAIDNVGVDYILPIAEIAPRLVELSEQLVRDEDAEPVSEEIEWESDIAELDMAAMEQEIKYGTPVIWVVRPAAGLYGSIMTAISCASGVAPATLGQQTV